MFAIIKSRIEKMAQNFLFLMKKPFKSERFIFSFLKLILITHNKELIARNAKVNISSELITAALFGRVKSAAM